MELRNDKECNTNYSCVLYAPGKNRQEDGYKFLIPDVFFLQNQKEGIRKSRLNAYKAKRFLAAKS